MSFYATSRRLGAETVDDLEAGGCDTPRRRCGGSKQNTGIIVPNWSDEETDNPFRADDRNFYKVEKWSKDGMKIERMLYAGNNLDKARKLFAEAIKHRPRIRLTIRQRTRVLQQWPK